MLDQQTVDRYLARIGADRPRRADLETLRHLQERQNLTVPFENLDYHLDEPIQMGPEVIEKIVDRRRGGGCYETNPALAYLLAAIGFDRVEILPGQVHRPGGVLGPRMCHLVLRVTVAGRPWLVDTGFGRNSRLPLRFEPGTVQRDPAGQYELRSADGGTAWDVLQNGRPLYRVDDRPARIEDFAPTLWWWRTSADSPFLQDCFCALATRTGRITLRDRKLVVVDGGDKQVLELADDQAVLDAYRTHFGISLHRLPGAPLVPAGATAGVTL